MSGTAEASLVLDLVSSIIKIFEKAHDIYDSAKDISGLPKKIRSAAEQNPLVQDALKQVNHNIVAEHVTEATLESIMPVLERCEKNANEVKNIFDAVIPAKDEPKKERLKKAVGVNMKSGKINEYMEEIFESIQLLAQNQVFQNTATLEEVNKAAEQLKDLSDGEEQSQFAHFGTGPINANTGEGVQTVHSNSGSGTLYAAQNQYFGQDQGKGSV